MAPNKPEKLNENSPLFVMVLNCVDVKFRLPLLAVSVLPYFPNVLNDGVPLNVYVNPLLSTSELFNDKKEVKLGKFSITCRFANDKVVNVVPLFVLVNTFPYTSIAVMFVPETLIDVIDPRDTVTRVLFQVNVARVYV